MAPVCGAIWNSLYKCIALAAPSHWITVKIDKLKFTKWLEDLLDVRLREIEVEGSDVKPGSQTVKTHASGK